jgi:hypothetical protein
MAGQNGRKKKLTEEQVVNALRQAHGLKTGAAELLAVKFDTLEKYIQASAEAQEIVDHWRKRRKDRAEFKLDEAIERGESWAIMFCLKNAKDREYSDRVDHTLDVTLEVEGLEAVLDLVYGKKNGKSKT